METRPATVDDVEFLTDVVVATSRDQGRLPDDFDEVEFRRRYGDWTRQQLADPEPGGTTCVVMVNGERIGRLRVVRSGGVIELAGIQLAPRFQNRGIGTAVIDGLEHEAAASAARSSSVSGRTTRVPALSTSASVSCESDRPTTRSGCGGTAALRPGHPGERTSM